MDSNLQNTSVNSDDVAKALRELGVQPGDVVLYHGSMKSIGHIEGGATAIIDGVLSSAPSVTAAVPTLWYNGKDPDMCEEKFDIKNSPAWNGLMAETMRQDPRAVRSNHWTHSVSAIGPRAVELTADHGKGKSAPSPWSETAFSEISPWSHLYEWNALYVFFGVTLSSCTMRHWIEARSLMNFLEQFSPELQQKYRMQLAWERNGGMRFGANVPQCQICLDRAGLFKKTQLGNAEVSAIRTRVLVDELLKDMRAEPEAYFSKQFLDWKQEISKSS